MSDSNNIIYLYNTASSWEQVSNVGCYLLADVLGNCSVVLYTPSPILFGVKAPLRGAGAGEPDSNLSSTSSRIWQDPLV